MARRKAAQIHSQARPGTDVATRMTRFSDVAARLRLASQTKTTLGTPSPNSVRRMGTTTWRTLPVMNGVGPGSVAATPWTSRAHRSRSTLPPVDHCLYLPSLDPACHRSSLVLQMPSRSTRRSFARRCGLRSSQPRLSSKMPRWLQGV